MISTRFVLTALALAAAQAALAQGAQPPSAETAQAPAARVQAPTPPTGAAAGAEAGSAVDPAQPSGSTAPSTAQPRYIQGNDQVLAPARAVSPIEGAPLSFNFEEAPVAEVARTILGDILKMPYVLHPPLAGTVTLSTRTPIQPDQAVFLLESALQANGLAMVRDVRGTYHVGKADALKNIGSAVRQFNGSGGAPLPPGYGAIVVPLRYIGAAEMATILRPLAPAEAIVRVDNVRNLLVLAGTRSQAEGWLDLVNTFDVDLLKGMSVGLFPLKHATIKEVEAALRLVSGSAQASGGASGGSSVATTAGAAAAGGASATAMLGEGNPLFGALRIMPVERLNSILVVTPRAAYLEEARRWIEKLDQPSDNGAEAQLFIYRVQNGNARHLASVLSGIFGSSQTGAATANSGVSPALGTGLGTSQGQSAFGNTGGSGSAFGGSTGNTGYTANRTGSSLGGTGGFGNTNTSQNRTNQSATATQAMVAANVGGVRVMADELNNSILVWSTRAEFQKIESTLKRLDQPPTQVLIDASIIEVTLNDSLQYGLQWAFSGGTSGGNTGVGQLSTGTNNAANSGSLNVAAGSGFSYSLINSASKVRVILNALASQDLLKVVSSPSLMVLDNHTATMAVGDQIPVLTSTTDYISNSNAITSTVQYRDTGVSLAVTPSVNAGNLVTMQIDQSMTDQSASSGANSQPIFLQRQISSKVAVRSGETIVLGGLIKDNRSAGKSGVPLLKDVPLLGSLFSNTNNTGKRTELLVVISPRVVRTDPEIREVSEDLRDRLRGLNIIEMRERSNVRPAPATPAVQSVSPQ
ncbi:general secretion pathway protein D [Acidovorax sp. 69]|uniref:type II secretion system secretin GspD n=1 Tax=Acidovorax sp. 69 TaxID=2035202 RepID=UPI000C24DBDA|nr:type II secretion system secretin GspD [Acidovorax sp. 69]PJI99196.1 general secretion pathway protein D [Acidovorax sp. 69]